MMERRVPTESGATTTEWDDIDVFVQVEAPGRTSGVIAIENKLKASEHDAQLARYDELLVGRDVLAKIFLTLSGDPPESGKDWHAAFLCRPARRPRAAEGSVSESPLPVGLL